MPTQIMWAQINADHISSFHYHYPGSFICDWKNSIIRILAILPGVLPEPVGHFLGNKYNLLLFAALCRLRDFHDLPLFGFEFDIHEPPEENREHP
jgi:hypothetical protein